MCWLNKDHYITGTMKKYYTLAFVWFINLFPILINQNEVSSSSYDMLEIIYISTWWQAHLIALCSIVEIQSIQIYST